mmetsp:Transcript_57935/g.103431  ORF Transcript_57935/g.103431 Transcript_57935/m.103431 type:complete len:248 (+) Transcript_57935:760-1503(+)
MVVGVQILQCGGHGLPQVDPGLDGTQVAAQALGRPQPTASCILPHAEHRRHLRCRQPPAMQCPPLPRILPEPGVISRTLHQHCGGAGQGGVEWVAAQVFHGHGVPVQVWLPSRLARLLFDGTGFGAGVVTRPVGGQLGDFGDDASHAAVLCVARRAEAGPERGPSGHHMGDAGLDQPRDSPLGLGQGWGLRRQAGARPWDPPRPSWQRMSRRRLGRRAQHGPKSEACAWPWVRRPCPEAQQCNKGHR